MSGFLAMFTSLMPFLIRVMGLMLDKKQADIETKESFLKFVESVSKNTQSAQLKASYDQQKLRLEEILKKKDEEIKSDKA